MIDRNKDRQIGRQIYKQKDRQIDRQKDRSQIDRWIDRQNDRKIERYMVIIIEILDQLGSKGNRYQLCKRHIGLWYDRFEGDSFNGDFLSDIYIYTKKSCFREID